MIKLKPRRSSPEKVDTTGGETMASTTGTGTDDFEDALETVEDVEKKDEEKDEEDAAEEDKPGVRNWALWGGLLGSLSSRR